MRGGSKSKTRPVNGPKGYIAFDLDLTLGCFQHTNPLAYFWGLETLSPAEENRLSAALKNRLRAAQRRFASQLLKSSDLLPLVLRKNIETLFGPIPFLKGEGRLGKVIIYSNSGVTSSLQLAADLIEQKFESPGIFSLLADVNHPIRKKFDYNPQNPGDPLKQFSTLQRLFKEAGASQPPQPQQTLFVDDRNDHVLREEMRNGLTYIAPQPYITHPTQEQRERLFYIGFDALHSQGLLNNEEYLKSPLFKRNLHDGTHIETFMDLFLWIWKTMIERPESSGSSIWQDDTAALQAHMERYLEKIQNPSAQKVYDGKKYSSPDAVGDGEAPVVVF